MAKSKSRFFSIFVLILLLIWLSTDLFAASRNGFELDGASIPVDQILPGGPPKDGIPAIDEPNFIKADEVDFLSPEDRILGVTRNGIAKAYAIGILNWHEIVNDRFGDEAIVITFCPLCGTGMAFKANINGEDHDFGVSGLLYKSDVLLYDRNTDSLWSQIAREAVTGEMQGTRLELVATAHTSWAEWREMHPDTLVLSTDTGHARNYSRNPYSGYESSPNTIFPVGKMDERYHPKELVIGLELNGEHKAYPFAELAKAKNTISDQVGDQSISITYSDTHKTGKVLDQNNQEIPTVIAFWFAWSAFYPETQVFTAQ